MPEQFEISVIEPNFVAEITDLRLNSKLSRSMVDQIKAAWARYPVLVFPGQPMTPNELAAFSRQLGDFGVDPFVRPIEDHQHVIEVRREAQESAPIFGASWHSDWSFQPAPPSGTLLHAQTIPPFGGDTVFADCYRAYATLPTELKKTLAGRAAIHTAAPAYGPQGLFAEDDDTRSMKIVVSSEAEKSETHPIVRTHPLSGRQALFINHVYTVAIAGMTRSQSRALLKFLFEHMTQDDFVYYHRWCADMLVLWDNRCVVHYASGGYDGYQRVMHRTTLAGERPA